MLDTDILKKIPIFSGLSDEELGKIKELVQAVRYRKGVVIFQEGDPGEAVYFIKSGRIKIYKSDEEGREYILHIFQEGDVFAEAVLLGGGSYPASAEAVEDSVIGFIKNRDLENLIRQNSHIALKIIKIMANRLRETQEQIRNLAFRDTYDRTACMLHKICLDYGQKTESGIEVELPFTRQEMAALVGTSRETFTRVLSEMKKNGIIDMDRQKIIVLDEKRLMRCVRE